VVTALGSAARWLANPPGIPVIIPGERITAALLDYLTSGLDAGMRHLLLV
jgi:arginine/lysine/ornithine decarboxylase